MSVTFKCKQTGNLVTFKDEVDIVGMRKHPEYVEVTERVVLPSHEESLPASEQSFPVAEQPVAKRGRPSKKA